MKTLLLNSTYEPMCFIKYRPMIKLVINNKVDKISAWNTGLKHSEGYDIVCGTKLEFYNSKDSIFVEYSNKSYRFCSEKCADSFQINPLDYLHPSIIRLRKYAPWHVKKCRYNRNGVFKRDKYTCQYCGKHCTLSEITIDHVLPRDLGGITSWENCVACCFYCNNIKGNRTPKQAGMKLLHKPFALTKNIWIEYNLLKNKHDDWKLYICN